MPEKDSLIGAYHQPLNRHHMTVDFKVSGELTVKHVIMTPPPDKSLRVVFTAKCGGLTVKGQSPMSYTLPVGMQVNLSVSYVDARGNPAQVDGETSWSGTDDSIAIVNQNPDDSTKCIVMAQDIGQMQVTCRADADVGEDVDEIMGTLDIEVVAGKAVSVQITPSGAPEPIPVEKDNEAEVSPHATRRAR